MFTVNINKNEYFIGMQHEMNSHIYNIWQLCPYSCQLCLYNMCTIQKDVFSIKLQ